MKRRSMWFIALMLVLSLVAAACADEPEDEPEANGDGNGQQEEEVDFLACQVTDTGGVDDRSFNQTAFAGMERAEEELGVQTQVLESQSDADFEPNINTFIDQGCDVIVTVGFLLGEATAAAAEANPDQKFAIVDFDFFDADGNDVTYDNVRELTFATDQAAFLAGYVSAAVSESGTIGTFGGVNIPTVTIFMNGYQRGMEYFNEQEGGNVKLVGWNADSQNGLFTESFEDLDAGRQFGQDLLNEGADVIMPVAGPVGLGTAEAVRDAGNASMVWVDTDGCVSAADICDLLLTSVMKNMDVAVFDTIQAALNDEFEGGLYVGTLENEGVDIAPYNEFDDDVPQDVKDAVDEIRSGIIDGSISVSD
ncbi:MAG TPA: BMP family ABC transporter substrate-binding protein [Actinomycetota bacterium]|nr:BMP family ABC transporter substrate-binding protein [Actinomycetota bacterium]